MKLVDVDVVVPSLSNSDNTILLIKQIKNQKNITIHSIVVPITVIDDNKTLITFCDKEENVTCFLLSKEEFSHSLTREKAIKEFCTCSNVVLMSNDIKLTSELSIYNLVKNIDENNAQYAFGKQVCPKKCIEKYIREKNYPNNSYFVRKEDIDSMQTMAFFSSDAFSAINRDVFLQIGGYQGIDVITNEDMLYSYFLLMNGYKKMYVSDAVVEHYHNYTLKRLYRWYYQVGQFYSQVRLFDNYKNGSTGMSLAFYVLGQAFKNLDIISIFCWPFNMAARFFGFKKGRKNKNK